MADLPFWFLDSVLPEDSVPLSAWSDANRVLTTRSAAEPGPYRTSRTPYLRAIMDDLSVGSPILRVIFKKCAQIGASEVGNCWIGYLVDQAPGPILMVQPTVELAKRYSKQRIDALFNESELMRGKVHPSRSRDSGNTILMKEFDGGLLVMTGANSAVGLRSMPVRYIFLDEIDAYPGDVEAEGDPVALAEARTRTFSFRAKKFLTSTPLIKGMSRISREYDRSDQRKYFVPCPLCHDMQMLEFARLRWQPGKPATVQYQCKACEGTFGEHHKTDMLEAGEWRATAVSADPLTHGYQLNGLYSPVGWLSWAEIAKQWEEAVNDADARKTFINTVLGEEWEEEAGEVPDWQRLYERREAWPHQTVPERGLFLTAGADVQADRIEIDVWAWGRGLESWLVEHIIVPGDPGRADVWSEMTQLLERTWEHSTGARMSLQRLAIDTGFTTQQVYAWARKQDRATVLPVRGVGTYDRVVPVSATKVETKIDGAKMKRGLKVWTVSVSFFKKELYKHLGLDKPTDEQLAQGFTYPVGFVHLPDTTSDEWIKQIVAEQQVVVRSRRHGFAARTEWRQLRPRNEALDCRVYARAAVWLSAADRWSDARWAALEEQLGLDALPARNPPPKSSIAPSGALAPPAPAATPAAPDAAPAVLPSAASAGNIRARAAAPSGGRRRRVAYFTG